MFRKKHKRKVSHIILFTKDSVDAKTTQIKIPPWLAGLLTFLLCIVVGVLIGLVFYEGQIWTYARAKAEQQEETIEQLVEEKDSLEAEIEQMNVKLEALSAAVNEQSQTADALQEELMQQSLPTDYPLTSSAGLEVVTEGDPMVIFTASDGMVVASAKGTVSAIEEGTEFGNKITVDHENGYISIYYNKGEAQVRVGDEISAGTTLFIIGDDNNQLWYQIMQDDVYIDPTEILSING
jgi:septal ring factor EnvC (AmiA/AmiB activator)